MTAQSLRRFAGLLGAIGALAATPAAADWREATTDHFRIYADGSETWLRGYAERLERFDAAMRYARAMPRDPDAGANRLTIYVPGDMGDVQKLCGRCRNVAGFYVPRVGGSVAYSAMTRSTGDFDLHADTILFHEYSHHFMFSLGSTPMPRWFIEGFAEFNGSAQVERDGTVGLGMAALHRAYSLVLGTRLPIEKLLDPPDKPFNAEQTDVFYGRSWLLTHMLLMDPKRKGQLGTYLTLLNQGKPNLAAAATAFGDLKKLDRDLDAYLKSRTNYLRVPPDKTPIGPVRMRTLSAGEAAMMPVRMRSDRGVDRDAALALVPEARRRAAPYPGDAVVQAELAEAEYDAGNDSEAEAAADRAIAADPTVADGLLYKGRVLVRRAEGGKGDAAAWTAARRWIVKANRLNSDAAEPLMLYYLSYRQQGIEPTKIAIDGLARAFELSPQDGSLRMLYARQLLIDGKPQVARRVLVPLAYDPHNRGGANIALKLIEQIDAGDTKGALEGADKPVDNEPGGEGRLSSREP